MTNTTYQLNDQLNGVEIYFNDKPDVDILTTLKSNKFRWNGKKLCWYAKQSDNTISLAKQLADKQVNGTIKPSSNKSKAKPTKQAKSLYNRLQFKEGATNPDDYNYKYVGTNFNPDLSTKEIATQIRKHLRKQFPEVKFSVTSTQGLRIVIKSSPYSNSDIEYDPEMTNYLHNEKRKELNPEIHAIIEYAERLVSSYNMDDSDSMTDYFHTNFYSSVEIDYDYQQTEPTPEQTKDIENFRQQLEADRKKKKEQERQEFLKQERIREKERIEREKQDKIDKENHKIIADTTTVTELEKDNQYYVVSAKFAKLNKNCTLQKYKDEVKKGEYNLEDVKITRELHFKNIEILEKFNNMLMFDFDFLQNSGGSYTDDRRINDMIDYDHMPEGERNTVQWTRLGIAVYVDNKLQYVIDTQGYNYARYVGLTDSDVTEVKEGHNTRQGLSDIEFKQYQEQAKTLTQITKNIDTDNIDLLRDTIRDSQFKLTRNNIQQITDIELKNKLYQALTIVPDVVTQFKQTDPEQGQKLTLVKTSMLGGVTTDHVTVESWGKSSYAQYNNTIKLIFKQKGKRGLFQTQIYDDILIFDGWVEIPDNLLYDTRQENGFTVTSTKFSSYDKQAYDVVLNHFQQQGILPIINTYCNQF